MFVTITVKLEAEPDDLAYFPGYVANAQKHFEQLKQEGVFGSEKNIILRYLVVCAPGQEPQQAEIAEANEE